MGPQLIEKSKQIAVSLGKKPEFKGSRGWLEKWKKRYNIKNLQISGESGDVQGPTVDCWKERLPELLSGFLVMIFGTLTRQGFSGKHYQTEGLG